ncbi:MAG: hypothetical protein ABR562_09890, partial [Thermoplasmatota archaeon]
MFGLPGNPLSGVVSWLAFVEPLLRRLHGETGAVERRRPARTTHPIAAQDGRTTYFTARFATAADGVTEAKGDAGLFGEQCWPDLLARLVGRSPAEVAAGIGAAFDKLLGDDARAVELLGGVVNDGVLSRLESSGSTGEVYVGSRTVTHPAYADATVRTP